MESEVKNSTENAESSSKRSRLKWWLQLSLYGFFIVAGQSVATLLGRLYFNNGGKSKWIATLVQVVGFPVLLPFQWCCFPKTNCPWPSNNITNPSSMINLASVYLVLGILVAGDCMLYSIGLQYLPVTTYSLTCATQLGFISLFSYFINRQKFTPYIVNSLVLLTISSVLLVFQSGSGDSNKMSRRKYVIGFICTLGASAGAALLLSLTQLAFQKIIKRENIRAVIDMAVYQCLVASVAVVIGIFASGDWKKVRGEMEVYRSGKLSYIMNLVWTSVSWQVFVVGVVGLVFKVSSLFSNLIITLGLPVAPILAVVFLHDRLTGLKAVALLLAMWGSFSYLYQHYLDDLKIKEKQIMITSNDGDEKVTRIVNQSG
ncbi:Drug/metabolite transporter superfamily protein [Perilla frutescens var. frutescens]|nr:Drug/metabolite transporter superfamily protein [Perilla frutescens var. frutescens]